MWEFAPAGGLHVPASPSVLDLADIMQTLRAELAEEVGINDPPRDPVAIAVVSDQTASSVDIVVRALIDGPAPALSIAGEYSWECSQAKWVHLDQVTGFLGLAPGGVIEPTLAIARFVGWFS